MEPTTKTGAGARTLSWAGRILFCAAQIALVIWLDYVTTWEISLFVLYFIPIAYAAWYMGPWAGYMTALLASVAITELQAIGGVHFSHPWIEWERCLMRFLTLAFVALSFSYFRRRFHQADLRLKAFEGTLQVCAVCQRIHVGDGYWEDSITYITRNTGAEVAFLHCSRCSSQSESTAAGSP